MIGCSYKPSGRAKGWGRESTVLFPSPSLPSPCTAVAVTTHLSEGGGSLCPSGVVCMPRLVRRSWRRVTVLNSCFFSSSRAETCSLSWPSDCTKASTRLSRLHTQAWDTWVGGSEASEGDVGQSKRQFDTSVHVYGLYLQLLKQVQVLLSEALIGPLQLCGSLVLVEGRRRVQQFVLQDVVLHLVGLELLGHIHLTHLMHRESLQCAAGFLNSSKFTKAQVLVQQIYDCT